MKKLFRGLPEEYQKILIKVGKEAGDYYTEQVKSMFEEDKEKMIAEGAKFLEIDTTSFISEAAVTARKFEEEGMWTKGLFEQITQSY